MQANATDSKSTGYGSASAPAHTSAGTFDRSARRITFSRGLRVCRMIPSNHELGRLFGGQLAFLDLFWILRKDLILAHHNLEILIRYSHIVVLQ